MAANTVMAHPQASANSKKLLLIALALGALAALMNWMSTTGTTPLVVLKAKKLIQTGTAVSADMFEKVTISGQIKEMRSLVIDANDFEKAFKGKTVTEALEPGQLLLLRSFDLTGGEVRDSIRQGQRAISIDVPDEAQAVAYFVRAGDSVDVWASMNGTAYRLKEGACIRAVGEGTGGKPDSGSSGMSYSTVTLVVPEADVEGLVANLALAEGRVRLSLIGPCDPKNEKPAIPPILLPTRATVPGQPSRPSAAAPAPALTAQPAAPASTAPAAAAPEPQATAQPRTPMTKP
jgi:Flp pilus assembly protein CpaB